MLRIVPVTDHLVVRHADAPANRSFFGVRRVNLRSCTRVASRGRGPLSRVGVREARFAHPVGNEHREEPMMARLSDVASDERTARVVLSLLVEPNDPVTGCIFSRLGAVETLWLAERDGAVVGLSSVDA